MERHLRTVLDQISEPIFVVDTQKQCIFYNQALASFLGVNESDRTSLPLEQVWPEIRSYRFEPGEQTVEFNRSAGGATEVKLVVRPLADGHVSVTVVSEQELKKSLSDFHTERLQTLGMLAGGVAHDFNNILAGILGHTTYLKTILPQQGSHCDSLVAVEEGARKASIIVQQILNFSRLDSAEKIGHSDLCSMVTRTCALLRGAISPEFNLSCVVPGTPLIINGAEAKIAQIVVNLVINSRDALKSDGHIRVAVSESAPRKNINGGKKLVKLEVEDDGHGMPKEVLERAFEPYYSTKRDKGNGLGLATVHAIVELLGGTIEVVSQVGKGTTISIYFTLVEGDPAALLEPQQEFRPVSTSHGERILVVDDEFPVRNVLSLSLEHLGYEVEIAASGAEAIERFTEGARFDLVILDMLMPNLSGEEVYFRLRKLDPDLKALIISGYSSEESVKNILENGGRDFIQKPFTIGELSRKVQRCLLDEGSA